ncbi:MAG: hypothetical protein ABI624_12840 [Casimicrobiaceae bacterium]
MTGYYSHELAQTVLAFCTAISAAKRLVAGGEMGPRLSAQMDYAASALDAIAVQLLEAGPLPDAPQLWAAARLREHFERLLLRLATSSLRRRQARMNQSHESARSRGTVGRVGRRRRDVGSRAT